MRIHHFVSNILSSFLLKIIFANRIIYPNNDFPNGQAKQETDFGDGLIPVASSRVCASFGTKQKQPVHDVPLPDSSHIDIIKFGKSFDYIKKVIKIN